MRIVRFDNLNDLGPYVDQWETLAQGIPFRSWSWASTWWRHYGRGAGRRLYVVTVQDAAGTLAGLLPCYVEASAARGRTIRLLGSGEVCSDYLGLMCRGGMESPVSETVAEWLAGRTGTRPAGDDRWDLLRLENIDAEDYPTLRLAERLSQAGCWVHRRPGTCCWRVELPASWDQYLGALSKSHRKQVRRAERRLFAPGRAVLHSAERRDELPWAMDLLECLHQRRRRQLNERGCFASERFASFHREVVGRMLSQGQLQLHWLELDGQPVAAEFHLSGHGLVYAYQAGIEPEALECEPGSLITQASLRRAIEHGFRGFDFLRGDEAYKAHWRAAPRETLEIRVAAGHAGARLRQRLWLAGARVKWFWSGETR